MGLMRGCKHLSLLEVEEPIDRSDFAPDELFILSQNLGGDQIVGAEGVVGEIEQVVLVTGGVDDEQRISIVSQSRVDRAVT